MKTEFYYLLYDRKIEYLFYCEFISCDDYEILIDICLN
jgi:hypothetical protein